MTKPKEASIEIKPKLINGKPFLEITLYDKDNYSGSGKALDRTTIAVNEGEQLHNLVKQGLYEY